MVRREICKLCPTPCDQQHNSNHYGATCMQCPLSPPRWGKYGRCTAPTSFGLAAPLAPPTSEPTLADLATNFTGAVARWAGQGFPTVPAEQYVARAAVCEACEFWDGTARLGLGKCNAPGCGCTKLKRWLATEKCPLGKWPELAPNEKQPIPPAS